METTEENSPSEFMKQTAAMMGAEIVPPGTPEQKGVEIAPDGAPEFAPQPNVPAVDAAALSAHMDVREKTADEQDNMLAALDARLSAIESEMTAFREAASVLLEHLENEANKIETELGEDVRKAVAYVKGMVHPSQWSAL